MLKIWTRAYLADGQYLSCKPKGGCVHKEKKAKKRRKRRRKMGGEERGMRRRGREERP